MNHRLKFRQVFITATDLQVGKTIASCALLQAFNQQGYQANGYKPIAINYENNLNNDATILQQHSAIPIAEDQINPLKFVHKQIWQHKQPDEIRNLFNHFSTNLKLIKQISDIVIIEGSGSWRSPIAHGFDLTQWVVAEHLPIIIVLGIQVGCFNHMLLTVESMLHQHIDVVGWIANRINPGKMFYTEIIDGLKTTLSIPLLGEIPYIFNATQYNLQQYLDISPLLFHD